MRIAAEWADDPVAFFERLAADIREGMRRGMQRATLEAEKEVVDEAPYREGNLQNAITSSLEGKGVDTTGVVVPTAPYSRYVHEGTGIYGPHKTPIVPRVKKALAFVFGGVKMVRKSVKGQKPNPFVRRARKELERKGTLTTEFWRGFNAGR